MVEHLHRCSVEELLTLRLYSVVGAAAEEFSFQFLFSRLPEATAHVEAAALTEFAMLV